MSVHSTDRHQLDQLAGAVREQLTVAVARLEELQQRRERLQRELQAASAAEDEVRLVVEQLRTVAVRADALVDDDAPVVGRAADDPSVGATAVGDVAGVRIASAPAPGRRPLAGRALRETLTRVALRRNAHGEPVHWRTWFGWLQDAGFDAAGKRAEATFQTQLARSPLVRRADREGVYVLDVQLLQERRDQLLSLHRRLAELSPGQLMLIGDVRAERQELQQRIGRAERELEEAWRTLTEELGSEWRGEPTADAEDVTQLWEQRRMRHRDVGVPARAPACRGAAR